MILMRAVCGKNLYRVFEILEARGFEVPLVNAREVKNVPGRKTDVNDAQWLQRSPSAPLLAGIAGIAAGADRDGGASPRSAAGDHRLRSSARGLDVQVLSAGGRHRRCAVHGR